MVSTTCAGSGLNIDDLNTLVIFGDCYSAESCVQLAGRVGRQGQQASVHFVMYSRAIPGRQPKTFAEHEFHDLQSNSAINKKQDIIETKNNTTNIQYQVVQFKGS
jgi:transcription-repair coupling factor (superfamily II helicase)